MGLAQPRILAWVAISFCRGSSQFRDLSTRVSCVSCLAGGFSTAAPPGKPQGSTPAQGPKVLCAAHQGQTLRQTNRENPSLLLLTCKHWPCHRFTGRVPRHDKNINMSRLLAHYFSSVQSLSRVWLFATPWAAARQASLSITNSQLAQTRVHQIGDAIRSSHPLSSPSPPALNLSQHQGLFQ